jgi:hypothetical protein
MVRGDTDHCNSFKFSFSELFNRSVFNRRPKMTLIFKSSSFETRMSENGDCIAKIINLTKTKYSHEYRAEPNRKT